MFCKSQTIEDNKAPKPTKKKQNQRLPPKRGQVMINILKGFFGASDAAKRREGELSSSSTTPAATPSLYNSDAEFES
ncbi:hypothetical protein EZV62_002523 [Acer yangbiense]|uniref:Uncharacterized protein n=1 Tax=Acer yangbiense TaxID=1000413 RepID=A0A5C7IYI1_9ROSI|nr:hypothetical protein EZV62_002523 [Acer yangbiense]